MKIIITGSLGHISRPVVTALVEAGHEVTVISSQAERTNDIRALGAIPSIGSVTDFQFLKEVFSNADAVYLMIPPNYAVTDFPAYQREVGDNYVKALQGSKVQYIVLLSSIGAHLREGAGPIDGLAYLEEKLQTLKDKHIKILRPAYFYYNFLNMAGLLKAAGIIGGNFGSDKEKIALVHYLDIADQVIHHLRQPSFKGYSIEYIASDERYVADIATVLGQSVGRDNVAWVSFPDDQAYAAMIQQGLGASLAGEYIEMGQALRDGRAQEDYWKNRSLKGKRKLESYAQEFADVYKQLN